MEAPYTPGLRTVEYNRAAAVAYARQWAMGRNPAYFNFTGIGGDCTNFASQCVYAGAGQMNWKPVLGWYYASSYNRSPSWTGVAYFYNFMVNNRGLGPFMQVVDLSAIQPGDVIQLKFDGPQYEHAPVVLSVGYPAAPENILIAAHTIDSLDRLLSTYSYTELRPLHVLGVRKPS